MKNKLTNYEKIVLAASSLENRGKKQFSAEDLVIEAWENFPNAFSLDGYPDHPDSNRVYAILMDSKSRAAHGWIQKVGKKRYQLSTAGRMIADAIGGVGTQSEKKAFDLTREQKYLLSRLWASKAAQKSVSGRKDQIIFPDACSFWDISPRTTAATLKMRIDNTEMVLSRSLNVANEEGSVSLSSGKVLDVNGVNTILQTHELLLEKFQGELDIIRSRISER